MKKLFLSVVAAMFATVSFAQSDLVATLTHGTTTTSYYGADALVNAAAAAAEGDVITLSSGTFNRPTINKAFTIRGAGMYADQEHGIQETRIKGANINIPDDATEAVRLEDFVIIDNDFNIYGKSEKYVYASRIRGDFVSGSGFMGLYFYGCYAVVSHCNCVLKSYTDSGNRGNIYCSNSVVAKNGLAANGESSTAVFQNCIIPRYVPNDVTYTTFKNCIIRTQDNDSGGDFSLNGSCTAINCIGYNYSTPSPTSEYSSIFRNLGNTNSIYLTGDDKNIFEDGTSDGSGCEYRLSSAAAAAYLDDNNTQVGIYGGTNPYRTTPLNPRITTFNAAATNNNGTLRVTINVE